MTRVRKILNRIEYILIRVIMSKRLKVVITTVGIVIPLLSMTLSLLCKAKGVANEWVFTFPDELFGKVTRVECKPVEANIVYTMEVKADGNWDVKEFKIEEIERKTVWNESHLNNDTSNNTDKSTLYATENNETKNNIIKGAGTIVLIGMYWYVCYKFNMSMN